MAAWAGDCISEYTSLKPFTYPVPETRFLHAGVNVYKFKIKYGNSNSINIDLHESVVNEELQDAVRIILGNLNNLCPFTTEHLIIFPYLNKWERVSDLRFMHGDAFLIPYPYVCTIYVELNSRKQNAFCGKAEYKDACNSISNGSKLRENMDTERAIKRKRLKDTVEISHTQLYVDSVHGSLRNVAKNATCMYATAKPNNQSEETKHQYCNSITVNSDYDNGSFCEHLEYVRTNNTENSQQEGQVPVLQNRSEESMELKRKGFLELLKSTLFPPLLQRIFSGSSQTS